MITSDTLAGISRAKLEALTIREARRFAATRPKSARAMAKADDVYLDGVPLHWMKDWPMPHLPLVESAEGAMITDIDGYQINDFCLGDTGSMLLGLFMATAAVTLTGYVDPGALDGTSALLPALLPLVLPIAVIAVPVLDLVLAVLRRTIAGKDPFAPDKKHLHHRLLNLGHSHRRAVGLMYAWTALIAFATVSLAFIPAWIVVTVAAVGIVTLVFVVFRRNGAPAAPSM